MAKLTLTLQTLLIISYLEENPTVKDEDISQKIGLSPQLVSYHREKHVEGGRLVTGYIPRRRTKHEDMKIHSYETSSERSSEITSVSTP
jgi:predicted transcriptional regulator